MSKHIVLSDVLQAVEIDVVEVQNDLVKQMLDSDRPKGPADKPERQDVGGLQIRADQMENLGRQILHARRGKRIGA
jgi:hypothetical protein